MTKDYDVGDDFNELKRQTIHLCSKCIVNSRQVIIPIRRNRELVFYGQNNVIMKVEIRKYNIERPLRKWTEHWKNFVHS